MTVKTDAEILDRINSMPLSNAWYLRVTFLINRLPFEQASPYLSSRWTCQQWDDWVKARDKASLRYEVLQMMPSLWEFANMGSIGHLTTQLAVLNDYVWLAGGDLGDLTQFMGDGKANLRAVCEFFDIDPYQWDKTAHPIPNLEKDSHDSLK